jgi:hypothetical protein
MASHLRLSPHPWRIAGLVKQKPTPDPFVAKHWNYEKRTPMAHEGQCFWGAVQVEVTDVPVAMGYCRCSSCRSWVGAPANAFTLWKPEGVKYTRGGARSHISEDAV